MARQRQGRPRHRRHPRHQPENRPQAPAADLRQARRGMPHRRRPSGHGHGARLISLRSTLSNSRNPVRPGCRKHRQETAMATKKRKAASRRSTARKAPVRATTTMRAISPCLWFDSQAEEAARHYVSIFRKSRMGRITRYPAVGQEIHGQPAGKVMTAEFTLNGVEFLALNGGPLFKFSESVSFQVFCRDQKELDYYWQKLGEGGDP